MRRLRVPPVGPLVRRFAEIYAGTAHYAEAAFIVRNPHLGLTVDQVARRFGVHKATFYKHFHQAGWPAPAALARWAWMEEATALRTNGLVHEDVARRLGRASAPALRKARERFQRSAEHDAALKALRRAVGP